MLIYDMTHPLMILINIPSELYTLYFDKFIPTPEFLLEKQRYETVFK